MTLNTLYRTYVTFTLISFSHDKFVEIRFNTASDACLCKPYRIRNRSAISTGGLYADFHKKKFAWIFVPPPRQSGRRCNVFYHSVRKHVNSIFWKRIDRYWAWHKWSAGLGKGMKDQPWGQEVKGQGHTRPKLSLASCDTDLWPPDPRLIVSFGGLAEASFWVE